ncbi:MAG: hypothetical protein A3D13_10240 [Planctomycetes bacterium RIFCSPHIGHO2_02_FULL_40_12]|nr:MAG: hypothetical protein A3D13_10240 [Planctomycetes bacterium RIFCSPHIGHO2_02_FULL_40_12]
MLLPARIGTGGYNDTLNSGDIERYIHFIPISSINSLLIRHYGFICLVKLVRSEVVIVKKDENHV